MISRIHRRPLALASLLFILVACGSVPAVPQAAAPVVAVSTATIMPTAVLIDTPAPPTTVPVALIPPTATPPATVAPVPPPGRVAASDVQVLRSGNVRAAPSTTGGTVIDALAFGEHVTLLGRTVDSGWYHIIDARGTHGWASATLLDLHAISGVAIEAAPLPPAAAVQATKPSVVVPVHPPVAPVPPAQPTPVPPVSTALRIIRQPGVVSPGSYATVSIATSPSRACDIEVDYYSGASRAAGLYPQTTDGNGNASWTWKVGNRTYAGDWPVIISCGSSTVQTVVSVP